MDGFEPSIRTGVRLEVSQTVSVDVTLDLGKQSETVDVSARLPLVESQSSNVAQTVTRESSAT